MVQYTLFTHVHVFIIGGGTGGGKGGSSPPKFESGGAEPPTFVQIVNTCSNQ